MVVCITDVMDVVSMLRVGDTRKAWHAAVHEIAESERIEQLILFTMAMNSDSKTLWY